MAIEIDRIYLSRELRKARNLKVVDNNTDVIVTTKSGNTFIAPFFAYDSIPRICKENEQSGNFLNGQYFWVKNIVLIKDCTLEIIELVINDLLEEGSFKDVFVEL